jgi:hypothetical protein
LLTPHGTHLDPARACLLPTRRQRYRHQHAEFAWFSGPTHTCPLNRWGMSAAAGALPPRRAAGSAGRASVLPLT